MRGTVPSFTECFLGEGNYHPPTVLRACAAAGSTGSSWTIIRRAGRRLADGHRGRAFALGYIQGLIEMMELDDRDLEGAR